MFVAIVNLPMVASAEDPTASATLTNVTAAGDTSYSFSVLYSDDGAVDKDSIDNNDVRVTGPGGFDVAAAVVTIAGNSSPRATYSIVPPGGSWDSFDNGTYTVVMQPNQVFDSLGNAVHSGALGSFTVSITASAAPAQLLNISTRLSVQAGENALIGGFIISGTQQKKLLLRALGPSLPVNGTLADPKLDLYQQGNNVPIKSNDNWVDSPDKQAIIDTTIPPPRDVESAIVATVAANNAGYTAIVSGVGGGTGVGQVEVYDLDRSVDSKLANISTRGLVQRGDNVMIGGFILGNGSGAAKVVVRGIGPSLAAAGVTNALADTTLQLRDGNGALVRENDNWKDTQQSEVQATGIAPTNELESAMVATVNPGSYTAILAGKNDGIGVGLVEIYNLQ